MKTQTMWAFAMAMIVSMFCPAASAHGGAEHAMGTVTEVTDKSITVETKEKKALKVLLDADTTFDNGGKEAKATELKIGDKVVVHAKGHGSEGGAIHASKIKFGVTPHDGDHDAGEHHHHHEDVSDGGTMHH